MQGNGEAQENSEAYKEFKETYAKLVIELANIAHKLGPSLLRLRSSQENSPYRQLRRRLASPPQPPSDGDPRSPLASPPPTFSLDPVP